MKFIMGVDLGSLVDWTAISILEETAVRSASPTIHDVALGHEGRIRVERVYNLRYLNRPPQRTPYPDIVDGIKKLLIKPELIGQTELIVDQTGVGKPVVDMMRRGGLYPIGITITGGQSVTRDEDGGYHVPKRDIASSLQVLFSTGRIRIANGLPFVDEFLKEMEAFSIKITKAGNDSYEALRENDHDDIVLSIGMTAWWVLFSRGQFVTHDILDDKPEEPYDPRSYLTKQTSEDRL